MKKYLGKKGMTIYCVTGDIKFVDDVYETSKKEEIEALKRCGNIEEIKEEAEKTPKKEDSKKTKKDEIIPEDSKGEVFEFDGVTFSTKEEMEKAMQEFSN